MNQAEVSTHVYPVDGITYHAYMPPAAHKIRFKQQQSDTLFTIQSKFTVRDKISERKSCLIICFQIASKL